MKYVDLLITNNDITCINGVEQSISDRASIGQDIKHMIMDSGLLVDMLGQRNNEIIEQLFKKIELKMENDVRLIPGTASITRVNNDTLFVTAETVDYGHIEVTL